MKELIKGMFLTPFNFAKESKENPTYFFRFKSVLI